MPLSVMGRVARAPEKVLQTPRLSQMLGFQRLIQLAPDYISWFISAIGMVERCQGREISMDFLAGA